MRRTLEGAKSYRRTSHVRTWNGQKSHTSSLELGQRPLPCLLRSRCPVGRCPRFGRLVLWGSPPRRTGQAVNLEERNSPLVEWLAPRFMNYGRRRGEPFALHMHTKVRSVNATKRPLEGEEALFWT